MRVLGITDRAVVLAVALFCAAVPVETEAAPEAPPQRVTQPDPLRSPVAPYRRPSQRPPSATESRQLQNYRTDLESRMRELEQARPHDSPRLMEERRELRQELDRTRRLLR